jgi:hypothetical protein
MVIPTITFANRSSVPDSADPSFQDYLQDQGQGKVLLQFGSLQNSMGTSRLSPGPEDSGGSLELGLTLQVSEIFSSVLQIQDRLS